MRPSAGILRSRSFIDLHAQPGRFAAIRSTMHSTFSVLPQRLAPALSEAEGCLCGKRF